MDPSCRELLGLLKDLYQIGGLKRVSGTCRSYQTTGGAPFLSPTALGLVMSTSKNFSTLSGGGSGVRSLKEVESPTTGWVQAVSSSIRPLTTVYVDSLFKVIKCIIKERSSLLNKSGREKKGG